MIKNKFYKDVLKAAIGICAILLLCKVTMGGVAVLIAMMGVYFAMQRMPGYLAFCYIMFPFFTIFNRSIIGVSPVLLMTARIGNLIMIAAMILTGAGFTGRMRERLPIAWMFAYCFVACLSSVDGWMPLISYLKITQFVLFLLGLLFVTRILQQSDQGLYQLRCAFMAFSVIFLLGSFLSAYVPSIGYGVHAALQASYGVNITGEELLAQGGMVLFNGMSCHSQMLAPIVLMLFSWVLCDMLAVEKHMTALHMTLIVISPMLLYMSRSRGGLLGLVVLVFMIVFVFMPRMRLRQKFKDKLYLFLFCCIGFLVAAGIIGQVRSGMMSKWIRKTDDVSGDDRSLTKAFTSSRQGLIEYNLNDFRLNPIFGKGFQVMRGMEQAYRAKMITWYSASVEKGVTPYVILGETGIMGAAVFAIFLLSFYSTCLRRRYIALLVTFTSMLTSNLADSTLFSPGGLGGFLWITSCIGGFGIDLISIRQLHGVWSGPEMGSVWRRRG